MKRSVWYDVTDSEDYIMRCSKCGGYKEPLKAHWFFTGLYCVYCIRYKFYDDTDVKWRNENES